MSIVDHCGWRMAVCERNNLDNNREAGIHTRLSWYAVIAPSLFLVVQGSVAQERGFGTVHPDWRCRISV